MKASRRDFLKVGAGAMAGISGVGEGTAAPAGKAPGMIYRKFGSTGVDISAIGVGGHHLGDVPTLDEAVQLVHQAIDAGVTFFDNAWEYYNGKTETILGRALRGGRREKVFLMTKVCTHGRSGKLAMQMLEDSLRRYQTDHLDLWQIHGIVYDNDPELAYAKGGVLEAFEQAKKDGKVRFVGFTGHKNPAFHLKMLELGYPFDSVQMPLNPFDANFHSFEKQVLPEVNRRGMAALGMKSMGGTAWGIKAGVVHAQEMLRYAMSLPVATTICGMDSHWTTPKERSQRCWTRGTVPGWCQRQRRRRRGDEAWQIHVDRMSNPRQLLKSSGGPYSKQAWHSQGECLRIRFRAAKSHRLHLRRKSRTAALKRFLAGRSEKPANKSPSSVLADIISGPCSHANWPYAWFRRRSTPESHFSITHGNTTTTEVKNGWDSVCREDATKLS